MIWLPRSFLESLSKRLKSLPAVDPSDGRNRNASWHTADEILAWSARRAKPKAADCLDGMAVDHLDLMLLEHWEHDPLFTRLGIRPAKYPQVDTVRRMWGHVMCVQERPRSEIEQRLLDQPSTVRTRAPGLPKEAPVVFASHSLAREDREFVDRVKNRLAKHGKHSWLSEDEIRVGEPIIDAVRIALEGAAARLFLLTRSSLGSAWGSTELESRLAKFDCVVWDSTDAILSKLLVSWRAGTHSADSGALDDLASDYGLKWKRNVGSRAEALEASSCIGIGWLRRPDKYRDSALALLEVLSKANTAVLPFDDVPAYKAPEHLAKFDDAVPTLGLRSRARG